jgi:hypothetical protein
MKTGDKIAIGLGALAVTGIVLYLRKSGKLNIQLIPTTLVPTSTQNQQTQRQQQPTTTPTTTGIENKGPAPTRPSKDSTAQPLQPSPKPRPKPTNPEYPNQYPTNPYPEYYDSSTDYYDAYYGPTYYGPTYSYNNNWYNDYFGGGYDYFNRKQLIYGYGGDPSGYY